MFRDRVEIAIWRLDFRCFDGEMARIVGKDGDAWIDDQGQRWERTGDAWSCGDKAFRNVQPLDMLTEVIRID